MDIRNTTIFTLAAALLAAVLPAVAALTLPQTAATEDGGRTAAATAAPDTAYAAAPAADTLDSRRADSVLSAAPRFDRLFLEAVRQQLAGNDSAAMALLDTCRMLCPDRAEVYYRQAQFHEAHGADSLATECLERAAQLQPANDTYQESVAQTYISRRDYKAAIKAYESLYSHHRERTDVLDLLVRLYGTQKDYDRMLQTIARIEQTDGESDELTLMKMNIYEQRHDSKNACLMLRRLNDAHPNEPTYKVMLGNWLMNHERQDEAYRLFRSALADDSQNEFALNSLCDYYRATGDNDAADRMRDSILFSAKTEAKTKITMLQQAIRDNEKQRGDSTAVLALFDRTLNTTPHNADIANLKAMYMRLKNMPEDSVCNAYRRTLAIEPENIMARVEIIQSLWRRQKWNDVVEMSLAGTQYCPDNPTFYYFLALAHFQKDEDSEALDALQRGTAEIGDRTDRDLASDMYAAMGDIEYKQNRPEKAFEAYENSLRYKDDNIMALNNYAYYLSQLGRDLPKAEQMSRKTIEAEPTNATYLDTYAWILYLQQRYDEARAYIDRALQCDTDTADTGDPESAAAAAGPSAVVIEHAGDIYAKCGNSQRAAQLWQQAIDAGGDKAALTRKMKSLKKQ